MYQTMRMFAMNFDQNLVVFVEEFGFGNTATIIEPVFI